MPDFRPLSDAELDSRSDAGLIAYIHAARRESEHGEVARAIGRMVYGYLPIIRSRVRLRVPSDDVEDVAWEVIAGALKSAAGAAFEGNSEIEFKGWMARIIHNKVVDYWRARERQIDTTELPEEHERDEHVFGDQPWIDEGPSPQVIDLQDAIERALDELERDDHRQVIDEAIFTDRPSADVAAEIDAMTAPNVDQIKSRFRKRVRELLEGDTPLRP